MQYTDILGAVMLIRKNRYVENRMHTQHVVRHYETKNKNAILIKSNLDTNGQEVSIIEFWQVGTTKLRMIVKSSDEIHRNSARAEFWSDGKWSHVTSIPYSKMHTPAGLIRIRNAREYFTEDLAALLQRSLQELP